MFKHPLGLRRQNTDGIGKERMVRRMRNDGWQYRMVWLALACLLLSLAGCGGEKVEQAGQSGVAEQAVPTEAEQAEEAKGNIQDAGELPERLDLANGYGYDEFLVLAATAKAQGDICAEEGLALQAYTFYAAAACELGSMRLGLEHIIAAKTGRSAGEVSEGSLYTSWEELAALFPASPYPDYFEGLSLLAAGDRDAAAACWGRALENAMYPQEGLAFTYLLDMEAEELAAMQSRVQLQETELFSLYEPELYYMERDPRYSYIEYLFGRARDMLAEKDYSRAMDYARTAVLTDPFNGDCFALGAVCALSGSDQENMAYYINEGLLIAPEHEGLQKLLEAYRLGGEGS